MPRRSLVLRELSSTVAFAIAAGARRARDPVGASAGTRLPDLRRAPRATGPDQPSPASPLVAVQPSASLQIRCRHAMRSLLLRQSLSLAA
jgi:hypothetical protein